MDRFDVTGMSCAACSARVEKAVAKVEGVDSVLLRNLKNRYMMNIQNHTVTLEP